MAQVDDRYILSLERTRLSLIQEVRNKGVKISNNEQIENIPQKIQSIEAPTSIFDKTIKSIESMEINELKNYALADCNLLEKAYFPNVTILGYSTFYNTLSLNEKNGFFPQLQSFSTGSGITASFHTSGFQNLIIPSFTGNLFTGGSSNNYSLTNMSKLKRLIIPRGNMTQPTGILNGVGNIEIIDANQWTTNTSSVKASVQVLIIRDNVNISSATNNISTVLANAIIYVPQALLNTYKTSSNWSMIADQIVALEGSKYEPIDWYKTEDWFLNMYHYTSVLEEEEQEV